MKSAQQMFKESVDTIISNRKNESVVDTPVSNGLCPDVWEEDDEIGYVLTDEADKTIADVCEKVINALKLEDYSIRIVGSICSNSYSDTSDIDIHISAPSITEKTAESINKQIKEIDLSEFHIGVHPFEVFAQPNIYVDMVSVGCFDYLNEKWLVGPMIYDLDFNPIEEYLEDIMKNLGDLYNNIHSLILDAYDNARFILMLKSDKSSKLRDKLVKKQREFQKLADEYILKLKEKRSDIPVVKSEKEALKLREDRKWKIADASLKLMGKLGYIDALKEIRDSIDHDEDSAVTIAEYIIGGISKNICKNKE